MVVAGLHSKFKVGGPTQWLTLVDLLCDRATHQPQQIYRFLADGDQDERYLTYAELDQQARAIAIHLQDFDIASTGAPIGHRALLLYPPGLEFVAAFFGCLYAGVIPVPAYLPRNNRHQHRVKAIAQDAQAAIVMTTAGSLESLQSALDDQVWHHPGSKLHWVATDVISTSLASSWVKPDIANDSLAFLQYTSGTTGHPKGVMVSHGNLLHNLAQIYQKFEHGESSSVLSWLPAYHDMGLIGGIFQPLYAGIPGTLMAPVHFLQKPKRWLEAIARYSITSSGGPNFAYDLCVQKITPEQQIALDLSSWDVAFTGAEPVQSSTLERFAKAFADRGFRRKAFYPCYGLAEATLFVTGGRKRDVPSSHPSTRSVFTNPTSTMSQPPRISCGEPLLNQSVLIVDPDTCRICDDGKVGEIWVNGDSVAQGYWQRPDETAKVFHGTVEGRKEAFLRTGDLGFVCQGELYITGRIKDVMIIRGQNHYPQDIEVAIAQSHPALRQGHGAVFSVESSGEHGQDAQEQIVVVQEVERTWVRKLKDTALASEIIDAVRAAVSQHHALQVGAIALVKPNGIPKTSSGKIQRQQCKTDWSKGELKGVIKAEGRRQKAEEQAGDFVGWVEGTKPNTPLLTPPKAINGSGLTFNPQRPPTDDALRLSPVLECPDGLYTSYTTVQNPKSKIQNFPTPKAQSLMHWLRDYAENHINSRLMDE